MFTSKVLSFQYYERMHVINAYDLDKIFMTLLRFIVEFYKLVCVLTYIYVFYYAII